MAGSASTAGCKEVEAEMREALLPLLPNPGLTMSWSASHIFVYFSVTIATQVSSLQACCQDE